MLGHASIKQTSTYLNATLRGLHPGPCERLIRRKHELHPCSNSTPGRRNSLQFCCKHFFGSEPSNVLNARKR